MFVRYRRGRGRLFSIPDVAVSRHPCLACRVLAGARQSVAKPRKWTLLRQSEPIRETVCKAKAEVFLFRQCVPIRETMCMAKADVF